MSIDTKDPESIKRRIYDDRLYYYKAHNYLKIGIFKREDAPPFKIQLNHLGQDIISELALLTKQERRFVLKQAVCRIFEEINFDMYHDSAISTNLEVILVN